MTRYVLRNGLRVDLDNAEQKRRESAIRWQEKRVESVRSAVRRGGEGEKAQRQEKRSPLRRESKKRAPQNRLYRKQRKARLGYDTPCAAAHIVIAGVQCRGWADTIQHLAGRRGDRLNDETLFADLCWPHHSHAELHPEWAKQNGLALSKIGVAQ